MTISSQRFLMELGCWIRNRNRNTDHDFPYCDYMVINFLSFFLSSYFVGAVCFWQMPIDVLSPTYPRFQGNRTYGIFHDEPYLDFFFSYSFLFFSFLCEGLDGRESKKESGFLCVGDLRFIYRFWVAVVL